jgi:predicted HAD superfamily Cof-like phosphohydrolase
MSIREQVIEFHREFQPDQGLGEGPPRAPDEAMVRLRLRLVFEEAFELLAACGSRPDVARHVEVLATRLREEIDALPLDVNIVQVADALADIDYVVEGARLAFGIDGRPIANEVHRSNMSKKGGHRDPGGKWVKPSTYSKADIAGELAKQGLAR